MKNEFEKVYQFRISLLGIKPPIWRRIQVPEIYTFWDLHVAIQNAMGWRDDHLHEFEVIDPSDGEKVRIGIPSKDYMDDVVPDWECKVCNFFSEKNSKANYIYDFGDKWKHSITLEKILAKDKDTTYPKCIDGKRACPPEDFGGIWRYKEFLIAIQNPKHPQHEELLQWVGRRFDPEHFDVKEVVFIDPDNHRRKLLR
jgi:hypothetical protein